MVVAFLKIYEKSVVSRQRVSTIILQSFQRASQSFQSFQPWQSLERGLDVTLNGSSSGHTTLFEGQLIYIYIFRAKFISWLIQEYPWDSIILINSIYSIKSNVWKWFFINWATLYLISIKFGANKTRVVV